MMGSEISDRADVVEPNARLWRHVDFLKLWIGTFISLLGSAVSTTAVPLTAVLTLNAAAAEMGLLRAAANLPFLLFALFAGAWVDRLRRRPMLIGTDLGRGVLLLSIPIAAALGYLHIAQLYIVAFLMGSLGVFSDAAQGAILPSIVRRDQLVEANTGLEVGRSLAQVSGPGLAGLLIQLVTAPFAIVADAVSYLCSAALMFRIRASEAPARISERSQSIWSAIGDGLGIVWASPLLRAIAVGQGIFGFFTTMLEAVYILYLTRSLGISPGLLGAILAVGSLGNLSGALASAAAVRRFGVGRTMAGAAIIAGLSTFAVPLAGAVPLNTAIVLLIARHVLGGIALTTYMINQVSIRQAVTPDRLQGRVGVTMRLISRSSAPVGALLGGTLGSTIGLQGTLLVGACGMLAGSVWIIYSPVRTMPPPAADTAS